MSAKPLCTRLGVKSSSRDTMHCRVEAVLHGYDRQKHHDEHSMAQRWEKMAHEFSRGVEPIPEATSSIDSGKYTHRRRSLPF